MPGHAMLIVHVFVHVKPDAVDAFAAATLENARNSVQEPGVVRFDVVQQDDDPTRFVLVEIYRTPADPARHKETAHYLAWRDTVEPMMAEPRRSVKYRALFPDAARWEMPRGELRVRAPTRIIFGEGRLDDVAKLAAGMGSRALVVEGSERPRRALVTSSRAARVSDRDAPRCVRAHGLAGGAGRARRASERCDVVVALGGGSVIDTGKAIAALLTNDAPVRDYLEVIGKAPPTHQPLRPIHRHPHDGRHGRRGDAERGADGARSERVKVSLRSPLCCRPLRSSIPSSRTRCRPRSRRARASTR